MDQLPRKKIYGCSLCKQRFSTFHFLKKHMVAHAKKKTFTCSLCHQKFISGVLLDAHTKIHSNGCPYLCALCKKTFPRKNALLKHVISCDAGCKTKNENYHIPCHPLQSATSESKVDDEGTSGALMTSGFTAGEQSESTSRKITRNYNSLISHRTKKMSFVHYGRGHRTICSLCSRSFKAEHHLGYHHLIAHCKEKPFVCPFCSKQFEVKVSLAEHIKWHNRRKKFCKICRKRFTSKKALYKHFKKHSKENPNAKNVVAGEEDCIFCMVCMRKFKNVSTFFKHISCHNKVVWKLEAASRFSPFDEVASRFLPATDTTTEQSQMVDTLSGALASDSEDKSNSCSEETQEQGRLPVDSKSKKDELCSRHLLDIKGDLPVYVRGETHQCSICKKSFKADFHSEYQSQSLLSDEKLYACCLCEEFIAKAEVGNRRKQVSGGHSVTKNPPKNEEKQPYTDVENAKSGFNEELEAVQSPTGQNIPVKKYDHEEAALEIDRDCVCEVCNMSFSMEHYLLKHHLLSHSEEKSFSCDMCRERFVAKCFLTQHMMSHEQIAERISPVGFSGESASTGESSSIATVEDKNKNASRVDSSGGSSIKDDNESGTREDSNVNISTVEGEYDIASRLDSSSNISTVEDENKNASRVDSNRRSSVEDENEKSSRVDSSSNISTVEGKNENASRRNSISNISTVESNSENASRRNSISNISTVESNNENASRRDSSSTVSTVEGKNENASRRDSTSTISTVEGKNENTSRRDSNSNISAVEGKNENASRRDSSSNISTVEGKNENTSKRDSNSNISTVEGNDKNASRRDSNSNISTVEGNNKNASRRDSSRNISTVEGKIENASRSETNSNISTMEADSEDTTRMESNRNLSSEEDEKETLIRVNPSSNISTVEDDSENTTSKDSDSNISSVENVPSVNSSSNVSTARDEKENSSRNSNSNISPVEDGSATSLDVEKIISRRNCNSNVSVIEDEEENTSRDSNRNISLTEGESGNACSGDSRSNISPVEDGSGNVTSRASNSNISTLEDVIENATSGDFSSIISPVEDGIENASQRNSNSNISTVEDENENASSGTPNCGISTVEVEKENGSIGGFSSIFPAEEDEEDSASLADFSGNISTLEDEEDSANAGNFISVTTAEVGKFPCNVCKESFLTTDALFEHIPGHCTIRWELSDRQSQVLLFDEMVEQFMSFHGKIGRRLDQLVEVSSLSDESAELLASFDGNVEQYSPAASDSPASLEDRTKQRMLIEPITLCDGDSRDHPSFSNTVKRGILLNRAAEQAVSQDGSLEQLCFDDPLENCFNEPLENCVDEPSENDSSGEKACNCTHSDASLTSQNSKADGVTEEPVPYKDSEGVALDREDSFTFGKRKVLCVICNVYFKADMLKYHLTIVHAKEKPFSCPWCDQNFDTKFLLVEHAEIHMKKFACSVCDREFSSKLLLDIHCKSHEKLQDVQDYSSGGRIAGRCADGKATKCFGKKDIGSIFYRKTCRKKNPVVSLVRYGSEGKNDHNNLDGVVSGTYPVKSSRFVCDTCTKTFKTEHLLTRHNLVSHLGRHIYACCVCEERFTIRLFLRKHMKSHLGRDEEKPKVPSDNRFVAEAEFKRSLHPLGGYENSSCPSDSRTDTTANGSAIDLGRHETPSDRRVPTNIKSDTVTHFDNAQKQIKWPNFRMDQIVVVKSKLCDRTSGETSKSPSSLLHGASESLALNDRNRCLSSCEIGRCSSGDSFSKSSGRSETVKQVAFGSNSSGQDLTSVSTKAKTGASNKEAGNSESGLPLSTEVDRKTVGNNASKLPDLREDYCGPPTETETDDIDILPDLKDSYPKAATRKKARTRNSGKFRASNKKKQHKCSVCNMVLPGRFMLVEHMKIHSPERSLFCSICNKRYTSKFLFNQHIGNHMKTRDRSQVNIVAEKRFVNDGKKQDTDRFEVDCKGDLDGENSTTNSGTKKIICHICKEQVLSRWALQRHKNLYHSINKSYCCIVCKVSFCTAENLIQHIPVHNKIKWVSSVNSVESFDGAVHKFFQCSKMPPTSPPVIVKPSESSLLNENKLEVCVVDYLYTKFIEGAQELLDDAGKIPGLSTLVPQEKNERVDVNVKNSSLCNTKSICSSLPCESGIQGPRVEMGKDEHRKSDRCGSSPLAKRLKRAAGTSSKAKHLKCSVKVSRSAGPLKFSASDLHEEESYSENVEDSFLSDSETINVVSSTDTKNASRTDARDQGSPSDSTVLSQPLDKGNAEGSLDGGEKLKNKPVMSPRRLSAESGEIEVVYSAVPCKEASWQSDLRMACNNVNDATDDDSSTSSCNSDVDIVYESIGNKRKPVDSSMSSSLKKINQALTNASLSRKTAQESTSNTRRVCPTKLQSQQSDVIGAELSDANHYELLVVDKWMIA
ncbi:uncharacterized protein [Macrobrachium rosenbergii]|uniref:uncharacterized protein isoform X1 n=1 Tax=Macrobrachium rosenbergii TaxID=79674 RepID=UPI0034D484F7